MGRFGGGFTFGINVEARDRTGTGLRSAAEELTRFAARLASKPIIIPIKLGGAAARGLRGSLGLLRDINVGLAPAIRAFDDLIEKGAGLEVIRKSFERLTGTGEKGAARLAQRLVEAANGTISLSRAMQVANRALGSGIGFDQLAATLDFISKKAITAGFNASASIEKVIIGLSRGSTLFLDDFGILTGGIEQVRQQFDKLEGAGAFDKLGQAAKTAAVVTAAVAEMNEQVGNIGVSGRETIFTFQSMKNSFRDVRNELFSAVAGSEALRKAMVTVRNIVGGIGSLAKKGDLGGAFTGFEAGGKKVPGLLDVGRAFAKAFWDWLKGKMSELGESFVSGFRKTIDSAQAFWTSSIKPSIDVMGSAMKSIAGLFGGRTKGDGGAGGGGAGGGGGLLGMFGEFPIARDTRPGMTGKMTGATSGRARASGRTGMISGVAGLFGAMLSGLTAGLKQAAEVGGGAKGIEAFGRASAAEGISRPPMGSFAVGALKRAGPVLVIGSFLFELAKLIRETSLLVAAKKDERKSIRAASDARKRLAAGGGISPMILPRTVTEGTPQPGPGGGAFDQAFAVGGEFVEGITPTETKLSRNAKARIAFAGGKGTSKRLGPQRADAIRRQIDRIRREEDIIGGRISKTTGQRIGAGGGGVRQAALKDAGAEIRRQEIGLGRRLTASEQRGIRDRILQERIQERLDPLQAKREALERQLEEGGGRAVTPRPRRERAERIGEAKLLGDPGKLDELIKALADTQAKFDVFLNRLIGGEQVVKGATQ